MKRVDGTDILLQGCYKAFVISKFEQVQKKFVVVFSFEKDETDPYEIDSCFFNSDSLFFYGKIKNFISKVSFRNSIVQEFYVNKEQEKIPDRKL